MAKLTTFEEWTRPWKDGEFDEEKAAKLIFARSLDLQKAKEKLSESTAELDQLKTAVEEKDEEIDELKSSKAPADDSTKDTEIKTLKRQVRELEKEQGKISPEVQVQIDRLEVALEKGLSLSNAKRLVGKDREELEADADVLRRDLGLSDPDDEGDPDDWGTGHQPPARGVEAAGGFRTGGDSGLGGRFVTDPAKVVLPPL